LKNATNANADHARGLISEYIALEEQGHTLDEKDNRLRSELASNTEKARELVRRQERIADELAPALREQGPVHHLTETGVMYMVADDPNESVLLVTKLAPAGSLRLPARFTPEEMREAAFVEAVREAASEAGVSVGVIRLPGRHASVVNGVAVPDQAAS
jgi:hypothetical protein